MTKIIAHRGFAAINVESTIEAFEHAAKSNAWGIETDIHVTSDGVFVCFHDDNALRLCGVDKIIEETTSKEIDKLLILGKHKVPTLEQFITICKDNDKVAVVELKNPFALQDIKALVKEVKDLKYLDGTIFISFDIGNMLELRSILPKQTLQFITTTWDEEMLGFIAKQNIDLDIDWTSLSKERIQLCHELGIKVNCWTLDDEKVAEYFTDCSVDFITTNVLLCK
jgi:glycerophosphoryl diester phosphodiesterase